MIGTIVTMSLLAATELRKIRNGVSWRNCETKGTEHPNVALVVENIAELYRATNRDKEAAELEQSAAAIRAIKL